jgi:hypothetical protein
MASSPLDPGNMDYRKDRITDRGHGTRALGPSDSSDSGSDVGDANPDSDSDRSDTGERAAVSQDPASPDGEDIDVDRVEKIDVDEGRGEDGDEEEGTQGR